MYKQGLKTGVFTVLFKPEGNPVRFIKNGSCKITGASGCGLVIAAEQVFRVIAKRFIRVDIA